MRKILVHRLIGACAALFFMVLAEPGAVAQSSEGAGTLRPDGTIERPQTVLPSLEQPGEVSPQDSLSPALQNQRSPTRRSTGLDLSGLLSGSTVIDQSAADMVGLRISGWETRLSSIELALQRDDVSFRALADLQERVFAIADEARTLVSQLRPFLESVERRLAGLALPEDGVEDTKTLAQQRQQLNQARSVLTAFIKQAQVLEIQANDLVTRIAAKRRTLLEQFLFIPTKSLADPGLWKTALEESPEVATGLSQLFQDWIKLISARAGPFAAILTVLLLIAAVVFVWPVRRRLLGLGNRPEAITDPQDHRRAVSALAITLLATALPLALGLAIYFGLNAFDLSPDRADKVMRSVFTAIVVYAYVHGLTRALFAPGLPAWRIVHVDDAAARDLSWLILGAGAVSALSVLISGVLDVVSAESEIKLLMSGILAVAVALFVMRSLRVVARGMGAAEDLPETQSSISYLWRWLVPVFWAASLAALAAPLVGYIWLGWYVAIQIAWTLIVLGTMHLLLLVTDTTISAGFKPSSRIGKTLGETLALRGNRIEQIGVVLSGLGRLVLIVIAVFAISIPWGFSSGDLVGMIRRIVYGLQFGSVTLSLSAVFSAILLLVIIVAATRALQRWLENSFLPHTRLDVGLKSSISTSFGYVGYIIAFLMALSAAGLNLQNIAIVAGALSVGVGLGLQGIVNNFVSGLILLAERPIKVGDWVVVGTDQGYVRKINVRATEIETFERSTVMIPNSNLISGVVKNWMHGNAMGRVSVPVGVSYNSDPQQVEEILLACARDHNLVLAFPAPVVFFMNFGESSLDFELRCYLGNIDYALTVGSDLRFAIFKRLREEGIEIPFPQRDLHLRDMDRLESMMTPQRAQEPPAPGKDPA
ncbi:mechanosensitive ion channel family protein [Rhizobiales bacterium]|uniref:DUF3772 domain-containing protein n=1 Tax=Hongsoonwoonella zoysiae TaxID=2821844 RepID=UPI00155F7B9D|nr:DUF3772 domain-containing protein [Hongsoonwoonella zoysiae]NRG16970.1 mechanosensitive ion channel family protein [Hongsoonwoonella zoysiae]